jgi:biotin carboxyl carrier protein
MVTHRTQFKINLDGGQHTVTVEQTEAGTFTVTLAEDSQNGSPSRTAEVALDVQQVGPREYHALFGDRSVGFLVHGDLPKVTLHHDGENIPVELLDERQEARLAAVGGGQSRNPDGTVAISAPMPGKVVKLLVEEGEEVAAGQGVIVVEAMKMENELRSTVDGKVRSFKVNEGDNVDAGECLVLIE